jgi:hypothetical protein
MVQRRLSMTSRSGIAQLGSGVMTDIWRGPLAALPVTLLGRARRLELPGRGRDIPFDLGNYAYLDTFGRETIAFSRRFRTPGGIRRFDDTMIFSTDRACIVNYLGSHQDIAADIHCEVADSDAIRLRGGAQRIYQGPVRLPLPARVAATADVVEGFDEREGHFTIAANVGSPVGRLFGYRGWFRVEEIPFLPSRIPPGVRPTRERRED